MAGEKSPLVRATDDHHGCRHHGARSLSRAADGRYRGLENHLYRVEVHSATNTTAKVKWSRENAHVATALVEIMAGRTTVRVESLGRDNVLRFKTGDWVELTSDAREFAGLPGEMRKVTVDDTNKTLTFTPALPIADFPRGGRCDETSARDPVGSNRDSAQTRRIAIGQPGPHHRRVDRIVCSQSQFPVGAWGASDPDGPGRGTAQSGDYWCFAARTADADIERLDLAPPLGLYHHYCHLAIIEADGDIHDCRTVFLRSRSSRLAVARWWCAPVRIFRPPSIPFRKRADASVSKSASTKLRRRSDRTIQRVLARETVGRESCARTARSFCIGHPDGLLLEHVTVSGCPSNWRPNPSKDKGCKGWSWWTVAARPQSSGASCTRRH